jgi:hypothetical protein
MMVETEAKFGRGSEKKRPVTVLKRKKEDSG